MTDNDRPARPSSSGSTPGDAGSLDAVLGPYRSEDASAAGGFPDGSYRVDEVPPATAREALDLVDEWWASSLINGQAPARGLADVAGALGGHLVGHVSPGRRTVRFDGVQVPAARARDLAELVLATWPDPVDHSGKPATPDDGVPPLDRAVAEAWVRPMDADSCWEGRGRDLLAGVDDVAPRARDGLVGLWWD
ncbi:hypothetical protein WDV85_10920 [Pseudokineococcus sp. 5B2Z-1]|uniref:hypothetical protein n=1 Tax=Pseudokineococcus sp. 5B2Z-1 TaxID=3132744 RepID=UPI0030A9A4A7